MRAPCPRPPHGQPSINKLAPRVPLMQRRGTARPNQRPARRRSSTTGALPRQPTSRARSRAAG
eukprot:13407433-Alexandrium_andersonii.AAC.1